MIQTIASPSFLEAASVGNHFCDCSASIATRRHFSVRGPTGVAIDNAASAKRTTGRMGGVVRCAARLFHDLKATRLRVCKVWFMIDAGGGTGSLVGGSLAGTRQDFHTRKAPEPMGLADV
jgi:hypothetical protein